MVASKQKHLRGIFNFQGKQQTYGLNSQFASVHVVAQEQI